MKPVIVNEQYDHVGISRANFLKFFSKEKMRAVDEIANSWNAPKITQGVRVELKAISLC